MAVTLNNPPLLPHSCPLCVSQISPTHSAPAPSNLLPSPPVTPSAAHQEVSLQFEWGGQGRGSATCHMTEHLTFDCNQPTCVFLWGGFAAESGPFVTSPTSIFPPATFPAPSTQNAFHHESATNQETNGKVLSISSSY